MIAFLEKYLIIETVEQQIRDAIKNRQKVSLLYKGVKGKQVDPKTGKLRGRDSDTTISTPPGRRIGLPVAMGTDIRNQQPSIRFYQTSGSQTPGRHDSDVSGSPWKEFRIDRITGVIPWEGKDAFVPHPEELPQWEKFNENDKYLPDNYNIYTDGEPEQEPEVSAPVEPEPAPIKPLPKLSKLGKIPDNNKVVLKPEKPAPLAPSKPVPQLTAQPTPKPQPKPITPPQGKKEIPPVAPPVTPTITPPVEPTEPKIEKPKPLSEWYNWLNKIVNN